MKMVVGSEGRHRRLVCDRQASRRKGGRGAERWKGGTRREEWGKKKGGEGRVKAKKKLGQIFFEDKRQHVIMTQGSPSTESVGPQPLHPWCKGFRRWGTSSIARIRKG